MLNSKSKLKIDVLDCFQIAVCVPCSPFFVLERDKGLWVRVKFPKYYGLLKLFEIQHNESNDPLQVPIERAWYNRCTYILSRSDYDRFIFDVPIFGIGLVVVTEH